MLKKFFKWLLYTVIITISLVVIVLAVAYWNRDRLLTAVEEEMNKGINGKFHIEKIDFTFLHHFPNFSVTLRNVHLQDLHNEKYDKDVFTARKIFLDIRLYPLLKREIHIK